MPIKDSNGLINQSINQEYLDFHEGAPFPKKKHFEMAKNYLKEKCGSTDRRKRDDLLKSALNRGKADLKSVASY